MTVVDRRDFLRAAGGSAAALWLTHWTAVEAAAQQAARLAASGTRAHTWDALTAEQAAAIDAFAARIIPTDDLPGAREAGAVYFIDKAVASFAQELRAPVTSLAAALDRAAGPGRVFAALAPEAQDTILQRVEKDSPDLFGAVRFAVICGTFANSGWGGNRDEAGWRILGFEHRPVWTKPYGWYDLPENLGRE
ncbi:MAG: gluconate 2-dehydrogenase subunit 3 family protein [Gemmatimonadaceae bacterium]|nr:gluconate 2-dehydrogenase subunit 3 family protein [Gemmatimonadaceae bacterium]